MSKKNLSGSPLVYSTDPTLLQQESKAHVSTLPAIEQQLKIMTDKKHRAGKVVTLVAGFEGAEEDLQKLSKDLKSFCGTGGSVKDNVIIIQGDNKEKIFQKLYKQGYQQVIKI